jgi:hypothetical protein
MRIVLNLPPAICRVKQFPRHEIDDLLNCTPRVNGRERSPRLYTPVHISGCTDFYTPWYSVNVGYIGHNLPGLRFGPDGKLYFSAGDRGLNVKTAGGTLEYPDTGCVLRCNPGGSELGLEQSHRARSAPSAGA